MPSVSKRNTTHPSDGIRLANYPIRRALVVDDDKTIATLVCRTLESLKFNTNSANRGMAAMHLLNQSVYDLVITDLQMPDFDGYALAGWVKQISQNTILIIMTGPGRSNVVNYRKSGIVDDWIFKPFSQTELTGMLEKYSPQDIRSLSLRP